MIKLYCTNAEFKIEWIVNKIQKWKYLKKEKSKNRKIHIIKIQKKQNYIKRVQQIEWYSIH